MHIPTTNQSRAKNVEIGQDLAQYRDLALYIPKIGDFVVWHGWVTRWYGIVSFISSDELTIIKENLPKLLFTMPGMHFKNNSKRISLTEIRVSRGGEYSILQGGIWFIDN